MVATWAEMTMTREIMTVAHLSSYFCFCKIAEDVVDALKAGKFALIAEHSYF